MKCIYCLEDKSETEFKKAEHVIPQSFGVFTDNFVLNGSDNKAVCDDCNQYFGDNLEIELARDSFEGIARFEHKVKEASKFKSLGKRSRLVIKVEEGFFKGAYAYRDYTAAEDKIIIKPLAQLGFLKKGIPEYKFFKIENVPDKTPLTDERYNLDDPQGILILGCSQETADKILKEKGFTSKIKGIKDPPDKESSSWLCNIEAKIDQKIFRAIAKIAFNYLSFWEGSEFVLHDDFNIIRRFIRYGDKAEYPLYHVDDQAILEDERSSPQRRLGHIVTVNWANDGVSIISKVSLLNWATYYISLARMFSGEHRNITRGHLFNVHGKNILELGVNRKT